MTKVCIIGAGCSGITTAKRLKDHGIDYDQFELSDDVGGNWYFRNPNGRSAVYESLHIDTSKTRLQFEDFPVPDEWPDFPSHRLMHDYFRAYVDHFGLRDAITSASASTRAVRTATGWDVTLSTGETRSYTDLAVANGHHWKPRLPDYAGHLRRRADAQPRLRVAVRAGRDPRQDGDRGRDGQLGDGHRQRAVGAVDGVEAVRLGAARRVGAAEVPQRPARRQGDGAARTSPRTSRWRRRAS